MAMDDENLFSGAAEAEPEEEEEEDPEEDPEEEEEEEEEDPEEDPEEEEEDPEEEPKQEEEEEDPEEDPQEEEEDPEEDPQEEEEEEEDPEEEQAEEMEENPGEKAVEEAEDDSKEEKVEEPGEELEDIRRKGVEEANAQNSNAGDSQLKRGSSSSIPERNVSNDHQEGCPTSSRKRRGSKWDDAALITNDSFLRRIGSVQLPSLMQEFVDSNPLTDLDPEAVQLKSRLVELAGELLRPEIQDNRPVSERSPSPEPIYNNIGIRINTREVRLRKKLMDERHLIISKLIQKNPNFKPPRDYRLVKKLYIPVEENPGYNFIGLILGPRGNTHKRMEKETGARISIRGKGSKTTPDPDKAEDLHVHIEADNQKSLDAAVDMVEKLLIPLHDSVNEHKQAQLQELALLNSGCKEKAVCRICGEPGHQHFDLPLLDSPPRETTPNETSGGNPLPLPLVASAGTPAFEVSPTPDSKGKSSDKEAGKDSDKEANLYVCHLPLSITENRLRDLFSPFGQIVDTKIVRDRITGISKGCGFVKFEKHEDASVAVSHMNEFNLDGFILTVRLAEHRPQVVGSPAQPEHKNLRENRGASLYVGYLPQFAGENHLMELFSRYGEIISVKLMKDRFTGISKGFGFVNFRNPSDAAAALAHMDGYNLEGHTLSVRIAEHRSSPSANTDVSQNPTTPVGEIDLSRLFIDFLPQRVDETSLASLFSPFGKIVEVKLLGDSSPGIAKRCAVVKFETAGEAAVAMAQMNGFLLEGHMLNVKLAAEQSVTGSNPGSSSQTDAVTASSGFPKPGKQINYANLYIGYLPKTVNENHLLAMFSPFGRILRSRIMRDRITGVPAGYGFVEFENAGQAATAIAYMNGYIMEGHMLAVRVAGLPPSLSSPLLYTLHPQNSSYSPWPYFSDFSVLSQPPMTGYETGGSVPSYTSQDQDCNTQIADPSVSAPPSTL